MKRMFVISMCLVIGITGCGTSSESSENENKTVSIDFGTALGYITEEELTKDNAGKYISLTSYDSLNAFGEKDGVEYWVLALDPKIVHSEDAAVKISASITQGSYYYDEQWTDVTERFEEEKRSYDSNAAVPLTAGYYSLCWEKTYLPGFNIGIDIIDETGKYKKIEYQTIDSLNYDDAKGTLYFLNIPEESWNTDENGLRFISVKKNKNYTEEYRFYDDNGGRYVILRDNKIAAEEEYYGNQDLEIDLGYGAAYYWFTEILRYSMK